MKSFLPIFTIILGIIISQAYIYAFLIKYFLMLMLFLTFLRTKITTFYPHVVWIAIANIFIASAISLIILPFNYELACLCFITSITPTATSAPTVIDFFKGNVEYVSSSVLITNSLITLTIPLLSLLSIIPSTSLTPWQMFTSICFVLGFPLLIAQLVKIIIPALKVFLIQRKSLPFYLWNIILFLATAKSINFIIYESNTTPQQIILISISSLIICIVNFSIGKLIGGKKFALEASQSLGQKNTMFGVWLAFACFSPTIALGPMFYLLYHNLYNSYRLIKIN